MVSLWGELYTAVKWWVCEASYIQQLNGEFVSWVIYSSHILSLWGEVYSSYMVSLWGEVYSSYMVSLWGELYSRYIVSLWGEVYSRYMVSLWGELYRSYMVSLWGEVYSSYMVFFWNRIYLCCCMCGVTHLTKIEFLFKKHRPENGRNTGRNMLLKAS